jgi:signal transduction histidine kinase
VSDLKAYPEAPTAASSIPPPPEELRQVDRLAMIGRLAGGIVREFVDQLGSVSRRAETLASGEVGREETRRSALFILEQAERMGAQARRLLSFAEQRAIKGDVVEMGALVEGTIALVAPAALLRGVTLSAVLAREKIYAEVDRRQIAQAVVSLLQSSIHACRLGGKVTVSISVGRHDELDVVYIDVTDEGTPFRPEDRLRLFEPFVSASPGDEETGLGLCVAEAIVREHGGAIEVGCSGDGNRFHVCLPRVV